MVFGGRKNMAAAVKTKVKSAVNRKKYIREEDLSECNTENHCGGHGMFDEDPEYTHWLEEPDPIVIDFAEDEFGLGDKVQVGFRVASRSFGGQGQPHFQLDSQRPRKWWPPRRCGSESSLALASSMRLSASTTPCPCETVQGLHSRKNCQKKELAIPDTCCFSCGSDWALQHTALACFECGGYGLSRPCGQCNGKCAEIWHRDLKLTHVTGVANWMGSCALEQSKDSAATALLVKCDQPKIVPMRA